MMQRSSQLAINEDKSYINNYQSIVLSLEKLCISKPIYEIIKHRIFRAYADLVVVWQYCLINLFLFPGYPSELYYYGTGMYETLYGILLAYPIVSYIFVPVYYNLGITSVYQVRIHTFYYPPFIKNNNKET